MRKISKQRQRPRKHFYCRDQSEIKLSPDIAVRVRKHLIVEMLAKKINVLSKFFSISKTNNVFCITFCERLAKL